MNRKKIISAVQGICGSMGYEFRVSDSSALSAKSMAMPAAVLIEPKFHSIEGRNHGRITYRTTLYLFDSGFRLSAEERSNLLAQMENDMLDIFSQLSENKSVAVVDNLQLDHSMHSVLGRGELGLKATAEVEIIF